MDNIQITRRQFVGNTAIMAASVTVGLSTAEARAARADVVDTSKILNYNPNMEYRR